MKTEIALEGLTFYAYHGFYEEERRTGNRFSVDIKITSEIDDTADFENLDNTVNYEELYEIVKSNMGIASKLLENVARKMLDDIFLKWPGIERAVLTIHKLSPPVGGPCQHAKVTLTRER